jgi:hypothetical protein
MSAQPEVELLPQYQTIRAQAVQLATALRHGRPREASLMRQVQEFQRAAGVVGVNDEPSGLYGPATLQALQFFLPPGTSAPPTWPGTRSGVWTPPAWVREAQAVVATPRPMPAPKPSYKWVWWVVLAAATTGVVVAVASKRSTATSTDLIYAQPWMYARKRGSRKTVQARARLSPQVPRGLPAGATARLLGY